MTNAFIFLTIFGAALLLTAACMYPWKRRSEKEVQNTKEVAAAVAGVGLAIIVYCVIGIITKR